MARPTELLGRLAGLLLGLGLAAAGVVSWHVPGGAGALGADIKIVATPTGELEVSPSGPFLSATNLQPGAPAARGELGVRNQTGAPLAVRVRAVPSLPDLDSLVVVHVEVDRELLFDGTLSALRAGSDHPLDIASSQERVLRVEASLPRTVRGGYEGRVADVWLELQAEVVRP